MPELDEFIKSHQIGLSQSKTLAAMKKQGLTIAQAIKASMRLFGIGLGDAKSLVISHPSWTSTARAAEPFQDELIHLVKEDPAFAPKTSSW